MLGKDLLIANDGRIIASQRTCNISLQNDTIEVCSSVSGNWREYIPSTLGWTVSCDGLVSSPEYAEELMELLTGQGKVLLSYYDPELRIVRSGYAIPTGLQQGASINSLATYSLTFQGTGELKKVEPEDIDFSTDYIVLEQYRISRDKYHEVSKNRPTDTICFAQIHALTPSRITIRNIALVLADLYHHTILLPGRMFSNAEFVKKIADDQASTHMLPFYQKELAHANNIDHREESVVIPAGHYTVMFNAEDMNDVSVELLSLPTE